MSEPSATLTSPDYFGRPRILQLDGLRALAVLAVLTHHALATPLLWAGVDVFFVLSGFLITGILIRTSKVQGGYFVHFYVKRTFRILPACLLAIFVAASLFGWAAFKPWYLFVFPLMNLSGLYFPLAATGLPLWSLAVEEQFYLFWPFVVSRVSERALFRIAIGVVCLTPLLRLFATPLFPTHYFMYYLTPFRADLLCAGAALAILSRRNDPVFETLCRKHAAGGSAWFFGALVATQLFPSMRLLSNTCMANAVVYSLVLCWATCLLAWALYGRGLFYKLLMWRPLRFIGRVSYSMYLMGTIFRVLISRHVHTAALVLLCNVIATVMWATVSWYLLESPLLRYASSLTGHGRHRHRETELQNALVSPAV